MSQDETTIPLERDGGPLLRDPPPPPGWVDPLDGSLLSGRAPEPTTDEDKASQGPAPRAPGVSRRARP